MKIDISTPATESASTGLLTVPNTSTSTLVAQIGTKGIGRVSINGFLVSGSLTDFSIAFATAPPAITSNPLNVAVGNSATRYVASAGDFAVLSNNLPAATAQPQNTTSANNFYLDLDLHGSIHRIDIYAKSAVGATISFDACAAGINVG